MTSTTRPATAPASPFLDAAAKGVLLGDGATGTLLEERGVPMDSCLEMANVERPELVRQLHAEYIQAGADFVQTNSFGANRIRLESYGLADRVLELNTLAVRLAREAAQASGRRVFIAGDIGPLGAEVDEGDGQSRRSRSR